TQQVEVTISNSQVSHESYSRNHNHRNRIIIPQQNNQVQFNAARFITHPTQENYINTEWYINGVAMELSVDTNISSQYQVDQQIVDYNFPNYYDQSSDQHFNFNF
ncbi:22251_t:CDS:1, partial [Entrophospora sp. SA101]